MFWQRILGKIRRSAAVNEKGGSRRWGHIMCDITNNCNLRCPFCTNDFSKISKTVFMSRPTFGKVLQLLPLVNARFFFSCGFEPTIHPQFIEYLEDIPDRYKRRTFFTTNLAVPLSDGAIYRLSRLKIAYMNISVESFNPFLYESLRRGAQFNIFIDNLERLTHVFSRYAHAPSLRYITMVVKSNISELPHILEMCSRKYLSEENEFRSSYILPMDDWRRENLLSDEEWMQVEKLLSIMPFKYCIKRFDKRYIKQRPGVLYIRVRADGTVTIKGDNNTKRYDINEILNPYAFFEKLAV